MSHQIPFQWELLSPLRPSYHLKIQIPFLKIYNKKPLIIQNREEGCGCLKLDTCCANATICSLPVQLSTQSKIVHRHETLHFLHVEAIKIFPAWGG